jgi:hypothetical protein
MGQRALPAAIQAVNTAGVADVQLAWILLWLTPACLPAFTAEPPALNAQISSQARSGQGSREQHVAGQRRALAASIYHIWSLLPRARCWQSEPST